MNWTDINKEQPEQECIILFLGRDKDNDYFLALGDYSMIDGWKIKNKDVTITHWMYIVLPEES